MQASEPGLVLGAATVDEEQAVPANEKELRVRMKEWYGLKASCAHT